MSMGRQHQALLAKKQKPLTPEELYHLSTLYGKNSPLKEMLKENREKNPLPDCFRTFSEGSAYDLVPEGEQQFEIPKKGTRSHYVMKELTPGLLQKMEEIKELAKKAKRKKKGQVKDVTLKTLRKSKRIQEKSGKPPDAPKKGPTPPTPGNAGLHAIISDIKGYREQVMRYIDRLDKGKMFGGNISNATLEELQECLDTIKDHRSTCKSSLAELLEACGDGPVYQSIYDEFLNTIGGKLMDWKDEITAWIQKKQHPEIPTPQIERIGETPGLRAGLSGSEENYSHAELMHRRSSIAPKGPLNFDELVDSDERSTPKGEKSHLFDSLSKSVKRKKVGRQVSDSEVNADTEASADTQRVIRLSDEEREAARLRDEERKAELEREVVAKAMEKERIMIENWARNQRSPTHSSAVQSKTSTEYMFQNLQQEAEAMSEHQRNSKDASVDQDVTGNTVREQEVEIIGSEQGLAADAQVDRPREPEVQGAAASSPKKAATQVKETSEVQRQTSVFQKVPADFGNALQQFTMAAINKTLAENQKLWEQQEAQRLQREIQLKERQIQMEREATKARYAQQQLQLPAIALFDMSLEEVDEVKNVILRESQKRNWHPEDAHRLVQRFAATGKFPAEFIDVEYIQKFRHPVKKTQTISKPVADETLKQLVIPPLSTKEPPKSGGQVPTGKPMENPQSHVSKGPREGATPVRAHRRVLTEEEKAVLAKQVQDEVEDYGRLEAERTRLADLLFQGKPISGITIDPRLLDGDLLISAANLRSKFDPYTVAKHYADQKEKAEKAEAKRKAQEEISKAPKTVQKQNLQFSESVLRRDEDRERRREQQDFDQSVIECRIPETGAKPRRKPDKQKRRNVVQRDPSDDDVEKEKSSVNRNIATEQVRAERNEPGPSLGMGAPQVPVNNPTEPPIRQPTFSREQIADLSANDPSFRRFLAGLVESTGPNKESTRGPSQARTTVTSQRPREEPSEQVSEHEETERQSEQGSRHSERRGSEGSSRPSRASQPSRRGNDNPGGRDPNEPFLDRSPPRDPPRRPPSGGGGGTGGGGGDDPSSGDSSSSSDSDEDYAGFNASISRASGRDPFKHAKKRDPGPDYSGCSDFDPDRKHDKIPLKAPEKFTGNKPKYRFEEFLNRFETYAGNKNAPEEEKFQALMDCLGGEAKDLLQGYTEVKYQQGMYSKVLRLLGEHYGDNRNLKSLLLSRLNTMQPMRKFDIASCQRIGSVLDDYELKVKQQCGGNKRAQREYYRHLESHTEKFLSLFPFNERQKFFDGLTLKGRGYDFITVREWFRLRYASMTMHRQFERNIEPEEQFRTNFSIAEEDEYDYPEENVFYSHRRRSPRQQRRHEYQSDSAYQTDERKDVGESKYEVPTRTSGSSNPSTNRPNVPCVYCKEPGHRIWKCTKFQMLSLEKRYEFVKEKRLCYHCLNEGHGINNCDFFPDRRCGIDNCQGRHHRLVHRPWSNRTLLSIEEFVETYELEDEEDDEEFENQRCNFSSQIQLYHSVVSPDLDPEKSDTAHTYLLPLEQEMVSIRQVTCDLVYEGGRKRVVVVLDTGANNTNIEGNLAKRLNLPIQRKNIKRELNLVHGSKIFRSNYVNFSLCPVDQEGPMIPVGAYTIDDLIDDTPVPDWSKAAERYPYLKHGDPKPPEKDDKCVLLVGSDFSKLHRCFEEFGDDEGNGPLTGRGPLGWYFQGRIGRPTYKGAVNFFTYKSLFMASKASVDWEPDWLRNEKPLKADRPQREDSEILLELRGKDFREKNLSELRSSEPVPPEPETRVGAIPPTSTQGNSVLTSDVSDSGLSDASSFTKRCLNTKILSTQSFPGLGTDNLTLTLVTCDTSEAESFDQEELRQLIDEELIKEDFDQDQSHTSSLDEPEQISKLFQNIQQDGITHPEMDNFGYHVILSMEERIQRNLDSRSQITETLGSDSEAAKEFEELKDRLLEEDQKLNDLLQKHWELDALGLEERVPRTPGNKEPTEKEWTPAQRAIDDRMKLRHLPESRQYMLSIPWKDGEKPNFRCNRAAVRARQEGHIRKLPQVQRDKVNTIFEDYDQKNYIRALEGHEIFDQDSRYLPYFCVCDELKETTPVRVVWDCRAVYYGKSLNSEIEETPNRLQDLGRIFLRLRKCKNTLIGDVSEMFLQVLLDPKDRRFHRFIHETRDYEWNRMLFGNVCSPNASQKVFALLCEEFGEGFPQAVETLRNSFYMDDVSDSRHTEEEALKLAQELIELLQNASMKIRKFYSNSPLVLKSLPQELLAKQVTIGDDVISVEPGKILGMCYNADEKEDYLSYQGKFKSIREWSNRSTVTVVEPGDWTKRKIAQASASIYDPHGLISPFTVRSKIILQEIWRQPELDWDTRIPPQLCNKWEKWMEQIFAIQDQLKIERWSHFEPGATYQIHTFCDASEEGMCATTYVRVKTRKGIYVTLLSAKARVSPLKAESISRLELVACTMGVRLSHAVREVFPTKPEDTFFWTDSMVCLHWINMPAKACRAYVSHRVGEIQLFTEPRQWRHVPGKINPADIGTRDIHSVELCESELWWRGPDFLQRPPSEWPQRSIFPITEVPELKPSILKSIEEPDSLSHISSERVLKVSFDPEVTVIRFHEGNMMSLKYLPLNDVRRDWSRHEKWIKESRRQKIGNFRLDHHPKKQEYDLKNVALKSLELSTPRAPVKPTDDNPKGLPVLRGFTIFHQNRFSTGMIWNGLRKMIRVMAYVIRAIRIMMKANTAQKEILPQEAAVARRHLIRLSQKSSFGEEIRLLKEHEGSDNAINLPRKSKLRKFAPFLDQDGIMRSRTRLEKTEVYGYDLIYPIILDRHEELAIKIVEDVHFQLQHPLGHNAVKAKVQSEYIILGLGTLLNSIKWQCAMCKRLFGKPCDQFEAALPTRRLGETRLKAFTDVGIDYAGPFRIVMGRGQRRKKVYILVMTCMATRAVHLEATGGMDTTDVINALSRFTDIRGVPYTITSDNQTSFTKANQDLVEWYQALDFDLIRRACGEFRARRGIKWFFNPPLAPHFGGVFETIVKAAKRALYATIGQSDLHEECFRTAISKITNMLNMRPIQKAGNESDWETLTPNHFINLPDEAVFPPDLPTQRNDLQTRLKHQIEVQMHFWKRFQRELIPLLAPRSKWFQRIENVKEGQIMIEVDENSHRGSWKLVMIEKVFPSTDSFVRSVEIRDALGRKFVRPISRLVPLLP